jgi:hypothetical protein
LYNIDADYLYISDGTTWKYFMTYQGWMSFFAALRPKHASGVGVYRQTGSVIVGVWTPSPRKTSTTVSAPIVQIPAMRSPSGMFKVSISSYGRTISTSGSAHLSVRVLDGTVTKFAPSTDWRSIGFYSKAWEHHGTTFLVAGMPLNKDLTFRLEFARNGIAANDVYFTVPYIAVEPVL